MRPRFKPLVGVADPVGTSTLGAAAYLTAVSMVPGSMVATDGDIAAGIIVVGTTVIGNQYRELASAGFLFNDSQLVIHG